MNTDQPASLAEPAADDYDRERRDALKELGRYAVYTPPAVMTLLASRRALADSLGGPIGPPGP